jgi:hypothetical protein
MTRAKAGRMVATLLLSLGAAAPAPAGIPVCDQLRKCAGELADTMAASGGWRPATIAQYRRLSTAPLEEAPNAAAMCKANLRVIGENAAKYHELGKLKRLPGACR